MPSVWCSFSLHLIRQKLLNKLGWILFSVLVMIFIVSASESCTKLGFLNSENFLSSYITFNCPASILVMCQACCVKESEKNLVRKRTQETVRKNGEEMISPIASDAVEGKSVKNPSTENWALSINWRYSAVGS